MCLRQALEKKRSKMKYGKYEYERTFLLDSRFLEEQKIESKKRLTDKYIKDTTLRLRVVKEANKTTYKLTQKRKLSPHKNGVRAINTLYLSKAEFDKMNLLQGYVLEKERHLLLVDNLRIGIDQVTLKEKLICIAEVEFETEEEMNSFSFPFDYLSETTEDESYSGFEMAKVYSRDY